MGVVVVVNVEGEYWFMYIGFFFFIDELFRLCGIIIDN